MKRSLKKIAGFLGGAIVKSVVSNVWFRLEGEHVLQPLLNETLKESGSRRCPNHIGLVVAPDSVGEHWPCCR